MPTEPQAALEWLRQMATPRPLTWRPFVKRRRFWYGLAACFLLTFFVGLPIIWGMREIGESATQTHMRPNQIAVYFGALFVVAFIYYVWQMTKQYENAKWLARQGSVTEANLLLVLRGGRNLFVSYRFWDAQGRERERDAVIVPDSPEEDLPELQAGDIVPLLYDPQRPDQRNFLWAEVGRYVRLESAAQHPAPTTIPV